MTLRKLKTDRRGQLNMMETLIAVSLLIVVSVAISASVTNQSGEGSKSDVRWLTQQGRHLLSSADDLGILRPAVYLTGSITYLSEAESFQNDLEILITSQLPLTAEFLVLRVDLIDTSSDSGRLVVDKGARPDEGAEVAVASYILGGYSSAEYGLFEEVYAVYLQIWLII
ncbi:MAG: hypothetical protein ACFFB3_20275 [Candidatus Hodarchaeota archaeon]